MAFKDYAKKNWPLFVIIGLVIIGIGVVIYTVIAKEKSGNYLPPLPPAPRYYENESKRFMTGLNIGTTSGSGYICPTEGNFYKTDIVECNQPSNLKDVNNDEYCSNGQTSTTYPYLNLENTNPGKNNYSIESVDVSSSISFDPYPDITFKPQPSNCSPSGDNCGKSARAVAMLNPNTSPIDTPASTIDQILVTKSGNGYTGSETITVHAKSPSGTKHAVGTANLAPAAFNYQLCKSIPLQVSSQDEIVTDVKFVDMKNTEELDPGVSQCSGPSPGGPRKIYEERCPDGYYPVGSTLTQLPVTDWTKDCDNQPEGILEFNNPHIIPKSNVGLCYKSMNYEDAKASGTKGITDLRILKTSTTEDACDGNFGQKWERTSPQGLQSSLDGEKLYICAEKDDIN